MECFSTPTILLIVPHNNPHRKARLEAHVRKRLRTINPAKLLFLLDFFRSRRSGRCRKVHGWLPPRDSNPDTLLQRQMSYH
jgi:hypothetical protein